MSFDYNKILFPYDSVRQFQDLLIQNVNACIEAGKSLIIHAPTGLGKTCGSLSPALFNALRSDLNIFFLTPRHTQHRLVIDTLRDISSKHKLPIVASDLLGRQSMCLMEACEVLGRADFMDYCKDLREGNKCPYYRAVRKDGFSKRASEVLNELIIKSPMHSKELINSCKEHGLCPYEMALELGVKSKVVVCDYFHLFSNEVRPVFLSKLGKELGDSVIIVDEAHNLPDRVRGLMTFSLSSFSLNSAVKELIDEGYDVEADYVRAIILVFNNLLSSSVNERVVSRDEFINEVVKVSGAGYDEIVDDLGSAGGVVREVKKRSFSLAISRFLKSWNSVDKDRLRVARRERGRKGGDFISLTYHCINPAEFTVDVFSEARSSILMSGTLTPTKMYSEVLGLLDAGLVELKSPFPQENRLVLVVPETTTLYSRRSNDEFDRIARKVASVINSVNVSCAVFLPSYNLLYMISERFRKLSDKKLIIEEAGADKDLLLNEFRMSKGSVLFAVVSGSFGEGVDLPGAELECIIVVGVPLPVPDLFTKSLINYYEVNFGKGWDYGYVYPALTKVIQSAGRCIRKESDRGLIVLLDERYALNNYLKCIPPEWQLKITKEPEKLASDFFKIK